MTDQDGVQRAFEAWEDSFFAIDSHGNLQYVTGGRCETGYSEGKLQPDPVSNFPPDDRERVAAAMERALETGAASETLFECLDDRCGGAIASEVRRSRHPVVREQGRHTALEDGSGGRFTEVVEQHRY